MTRTFALTAEVIERRRQPAAEEMMPDAVDRDSGRERIVRSGEPLRQLQAAALFRVDNGRLSQADRRQEAARDRVAAVFRISATTDAGLGQRGLLDAHGLAAITEL